MSGDQQQEYSNEIFELGGIIYSLNKKELTASVIDSKLENEDIIIPRAINYQSAIYSVTKLSKESFCNSKVKSIQFPNDSLLQTIEYKAFYNSSIEKLTIPSSLINLENGWCLLTPSLKSIDISPKNLRYLCLNNQFIIGKSKITNKLYDTLVFCLHDSENIKIPSFIEYIDKYSFCNCKILKRIEIKTLSKIQTTIIEEFKGMPIEIYSTQQIDTYLLNPTKRCQETPEFVHFKDEIYTFQNYNYDGILYNCIYGKDRRIKERCRSQILVPYTIHSKPKWEGDVIVKNSIHCNHPEIQPAKAPYFTERQIVEQIEKIYLSSTPRYGRYKSFNLLLQYIKENTPPNVPLTHVSESFFNKIYFTLEKQYQKNDEIEFYKNLRGENFELFTNNFVENETGETMTISCFSSPFQLEMVKKSKIIGIDCTFRTAPPQFKQIMVLMGKTKRLNLPLAYILLPSKSEKIYKMALGTYRSYIDHFANNVTFISDFELGEINSIKSVFMPEGSEFQLCFFHFAKALKSYFARDLENYIKAEEIQKQQNQIEDPNFNFQRKIEVKKNINKMLKKCAKIFPFIQHKKVYLAIEVLNSFHQTKEFAKYFSETYLKRYNINDWSVIGKKQSTIITNNFVERHNRKLNETFDHPHPTLQEFKEKISQLESEYYNMYTNGDEHKETEYKHYTEEDFDATFNELKNYLLNHVKQIQKIPHPQKEQNEDSSNINNIKDLPDNLLQMLKSSCQKFFSLPPRSIERHELLQRIEKEINNKNITYNKIRRWFNNNKENYENYISKDDSDDNQ